MGQGGRVVHAVPNHGKRPVLLHQRLDGGHLVLRQEIGLDLIDAQGLSDGVGHAPVVTRQHDQRAQSDLPQAHQHVARLQTWLVSQAEHAKPLRAVTHDHHAAPGLLLFLDRDVDEDRYFDLAIRPELRTANLDRLPFDIGPNTPRGDAVERTGLGQRQLSCRSRSNDRLCKWMLRLSFNRGSDAEQ